METDKVLSWEKMEIGDIWCSPQSFSCLLTSVFVASNVQAWGTSGGTGKSLGANLLQGLETSAL